MKKVKNVLYLAGPLALVSFALMDYVGGMNYPGYDWPNQCLEDLVAMDSYCLVLALVFAIIAALLAIFAIILVYKFFKSWKKINKTFLRGILCVVLAVCVFCIGFNVFHEPNAGTVEYIMEQVQQIKAENQKIYDAEAEIAEANSSSSSSETDSSLVGQTSDGANVTVDDSTTSSSSSATTDNTTDTSTQQSTIDSSKEKIEEIRNNIKEKAHEPMLFCMSATIGVMLILMALGAIFIGIGGLKKGRFKVIAWVTIILVALGYIAMLYNIAGSSYFGISLRVIDYLPFALTAFLSAWVYAYEPKEK